MLMADAHPSVFFSGKIIKIGQQAEKKQEWGNASYYEVNIVFDQKPSIRLIPGMSIQVRVLNSISEQISLQQSSTNSSEQTRLESTGEQS